jgi:hypothetical protein
MLFVSYSLDELPLSQRWNISSASLLWKHPQTYLQLFQSLYFILSAHLLGLKTFRTLTKSERVREILIEGIGWVINRFSWDRKGTSDGI